MVVMCGINGFNFKDEGLIQQMNQAVSHRGPDDAGFFVDEGISLGHQRLSIIDLSERGHQPMKSQNNNFTIVFNGEIYNFKEIRKNLENKYTFKSETDTEVVLCAYQEYGPRCLELFNGIFAFVIWDNHKKELFLARDRVGVKPLYYYYDSKKFIFSSEVKAILESGVAREICPRAFNLYFRMLYTPAPYTMFKGIKKLMPGHYATLRDNNLQIKKYWEVNDFSARGGCASGAENLEDRGEAVDGIRSLIKNSVRMQLMSDRPVGVFLSGGIDSTAILGITREIAPHITKTYSVGFDTPEESEKFNADFELARKTAKFYGTDHHRLKVSGRDVLENIEKIIWHMDEPVANATMVPMYLLAREAKKEVAVVLGGDGGDELFGGYQRYYYSYLISKYQRMPTLLRSCIEKIIPNPKIIEKFRTNPGIERFLSFHAQKDEILSRVLQPEIFNKDLICNFYSNFFNNQQSTINDQDFEKHFMDVDRQSWLVDESLLRTDKMTMAHGLEQRVPILDHRLVELANKIPTKWKIDPFSKLQGKKIWAEAVKEYLPDYILREKKRGWFSPTSKWLRTDLRDFALDTINQLDNSMFKRDEIKKILDNHVEKRQYNLNIIWALINWQVWYNRFIK